MIAHEMSHVFEADARPIANLTANEITLHVPVVANAGVVVANVLYASGNVVCQKDSYLKMPRNYGPMVERRYPSADTNRYGISMGPRTIRMYAAGGVAGAPRVALSFATAENEYTDALSTTDNTANINTNVVMEGDNMLTWRNLTSRKNMLQLWGPPDASVDDSANVYAIGTETDTLRFGVPGGSMHRFYSNDVLTAQLSESKNWFHRDFQVQRANLHVVGTTAEPKFINVDVGVTRVAASVHKNNKVCVGTGAGADAHDPDETRVYGLGTVRDGLVARTANDNGVVRLYSNTNFIAHFSYGALDGLSTDAGRLRIGAPIQMNGYQLFLAHDSACKPGGGSWATSSDERVKTDIELANLDMCWDTVKALPLKRFAWLDPVRSATGDRHALGWIAQDVQTLLPKAVQASAATVTTPEGTEVLGGESHLMLDSDQILKVMYGALQKAVRELDDLEVGVRTVLDDARALATPVATPVATA